MQTDTNPILEASGITRVFTVGEVETVALKDVSLSFSSGEFACLSGWSGSGKTTLLNIMGTLDDPTEGTVRIRGNDPSVMKDAARTKFRLDNIGFIFQAYNLVPVLTGLENAELLLVLQGVAKKERRERVLPVLEKLGIADIADKRPAQMSGGQQQRFAVARAIAPKPAIILADEPTANLDSSTSKELMDHMQMLNEENNVTFLFSSHDSLIHERAKRLIELRDGMLFSDEACAP